MRRRSLSSVTVRSLDRDATIADLRRLAGEIGAAHPEITEIRLFGSLARDERNPYADADLLIVIESCEDSPRDRGPRYRPDRSPVPLDLTVCTRAELDREVAAGNAFVLRALEESIPLYGRAQASRGSAPDSASSRGLA